MNISIHNYLPKSTQLRSWQQDKHTILLELGSKAILLQMYFPSERTPFSPFQCEFSGTVSLRAALSVISLAEHI